MSDKGNYEIIDCDKNGEKYVQDGYQAVAEQNIAMRVRDYLNERVAWRYFILIALLNLIVMSSTMIVAHEISSPFSLWFIDTTLLMLMAGGYVLIVGFCWDISLILFGMFIDFLRGRLRLNIPERLSLAGSRSLRFFPSGIAGIFIILLTSYAILGTSNITLLSFKVLGTITEWRDPIFWNLEGPLFQWLSTLAINTTFWDALYHSCWLLEMTMVCFLVIVSQGSRVVFFYGYSMIILYYVGRFVGMLSPVKGPAFYMPQYFDHADGSLTKMAVEKLTTTLSLPPEQAIEQGGILLGGISAMPSLHIGMVILTSYWLYTARKWTVFITAPWIIMVWISTVVLGWHYLIDGVGGLFLAIFSIWATRFLLKFSWCGLAKNI